MRVFLIFRGHSHEADVESTATRVILVEKLSRAVGTPIAPDAKFIFRGSILSEQTTLSDAGLRDGANILVQASTVDEVAAVEHHATFRIRDDLTADKRRRRLPRETASRRTGLVGFGEKRFGFGTIKVLEGLPDKGKARAVLQRIATDRAVLAVMKERGWYVPELCEMYPDGKVGVDPVCVLGLNVNKGAQIRLRIRTDDLQGFRKFGIVMKTVWHELAHNQISEHTGEFYALVSQLERDGQRLDWTQHGGRRAAAGRGGDGIFEGFHRESDGGDNDDVDYGYEGDTQVLGQGDDNIHVGSSSSGSNSGARVSARETAAIAAQRRAAAAAAGAAVGCSSPGEGEDHTGCDHDHDRHYHHNGASSGAHPTPAAGAGTGGYIGSSPPHTGGVLETEGVHVDVDMTNSSHSSSEAPSDDDHDVDAGGGGSSGTDNDVGSGAAGPARDPSLTLQVQQQQHDVNMDPAATAALFTRETNQNGHVSQSIQSASPAATVSATAASATAASASVSPSLPSSAAPDTSGSSRHSQPTLGVLAAPDETLSAELEAAAQATLLRRQKMTDALSKVDSDLRSAYAIGQGGGDAGEAAVQAAYQLLDGILDRASTAVAMGEAGGAEAAKYKQIRPSNAAFQKKTGGSSAAIDFLLAAGFRQQLASPADDAQTGGSGPWLRLPAGRNVDVGSLWLAREVLRERIGLEGP